MGEQLLYVFPELHHWSVSGIPWQVLLWFPHHATEHRCRPLPHAFSQPWVTLWRHVQKTFPSLAAMIYRLVTFCDCHSRKTIGLLINWLDHISPGGRLTEEKLQAHVDPQKTLCFLCGPPPMIEAISKTLLDAGLPKDRILFEKWW